MKLQFVEDEETGELETPKPKIRKPPEKILPTIKDIEIEKKARILNIVGYELDEITIDEARAYYIVICKEKPKHDSIQTKNFLINRIIKKLEQSKSKKTKWK